MRTSDKTSVPDSPLIGQKHQNSRKPPCGEYDSCPSVVISNSKLKETTEKDIKLIRAQQLRDGFQTMALVLGFSLAGILCLLGASRFEAGLAQLAVILLILVPALALALSDSIALPGYLTFVWAFGPGIRRVFDWQISSFQQISLLSLLPYLASLTMLIPILRHSKPMGNLLRKITYIFGISLMFGLVIGLPRNGSGAIFDLLSYFVPLLLLPYLWNLSPDDATIDKIVRSLVVVACLASAYGWIQYLIMPPWDAFWMIASGGTSFGQPLPFQVRVFAAANSPGAFAVFLSLAFALGVTNPRWRAGVGWPGVFLIFTCLCLTEVRACWIGALLTIIVYLSIGKSANKSKTLFSFFLFFSICAVAVPFLPGGKKVVDRLSSFQKGGNDGSLQQRAKTGINVLGQSLKSPIGHGLGSTGVASAKASQETGIGVIDNGYLTMLYTFGVILTPLMVATLFLCLSGALRSLRQYGGDFSAGRFAAASLIGSLAIMYSGNNLTGLAGFFTWLPVALWLGAAYRPPLSPATK